MTWNSPNVTVSQCGAVNKCDLLLVTHVTWESEQWCCVCQSYKDWNMFPNWTGPLTTNCLMLCSAMCSAAHSKVCVCVCVKITHMYVSPSVCAVVARWRCVSEYDEQLFLSAISACHIWLGSSSPVTADMKSDHVFCSQICRMDLNTDAGMIWITRDTLKYVSAWLMNIN